MLQLTAADVAKVTVHPNTKGDPEIVGRLLEALSCMRQLPAFSRGQMYYDFDLGKVRIAAPGML